MRTLKPVRIPDSLFDRVEKEILKAFQRMIYQPLARATIKRVDNSKETLRKAIQDGRVVFYRGIQKSYGVSKNKAKFLARQETKLMMASYKKARYLSSGVEEYKWKCVAGSPAHPVRPDHLRLKDTIHRYDDPPITNTKTGAKNNPGQDFGCRCYDQPVVRFNETKSVS